MSNQDPSVHVSFFFFFSLHMGCSNRYVNLYIKCIHAVLVSYPARLMFLWDAIREWKLHSTTSFWDTSTYLPSWKDWIIFFTSWCQNERTNERNTQILFPHGWGNKINNVDLVFQASDMKKTLRPCQSPGLEMIPPLEFKFFNTGLQSFPQEMIDRCTEARNAVDIFICTYCV